MAVSVQDLRRVADALDSIRGQDVLDATVRPDLRQLRLTFTGGSILVVGAGADAHGRLEVDIVRPVEETPDQLDVPFEPDVVGGGGRR
ncbi:MAG: hypothetical protein WBC97_00525 [Gemmatimonadales bacterium]